MRFVVAVCLVLAAGCSTVEKSQSAKRDLGRIAVIDAIGLTRAELETRLGLKPAKRIFVREASIQNGELVTLVSGRSLAGGVTCEGGAPASLRFELGGHWLGDADIRFAGARIAGVMHRPTNKDGEPGAQEVAAVCVDVLKSVKDQSQDVFATVVAAPVILPLAGVFGGVNAVTANDINTPLSKLPLGAAVEGGLDAYVAKLPAGALATSRDGGNATIEFRFHLRKEVPANQRGIADAVVHIVDGSVARLKSERNCVLTEARALSCERGFP